MAASYLLAALAPCAAADSLVSEANEWKPGRPIPPRLLEFRDATRSNSCFHLPGATAPVFEGTTNSDLFIQIVCHKYVDARIFDCAVKSGLKAMGPTRFFTALNERYKLLPHMLTLERHRNLAAQATKKHVVVDGVFVNEGNMEQTEAQSVLNEIQGKLRAGLPWGKVQREYYERYSYQKVVSAKDGKPVTGTRTKIGNFGDYIVSDGKGEAMGLRACSLPTEHVPILLSGSEGDVLILNAPKERMLILYQIREVYSPKAAEGSAGEKK